MFRQGQLAVHGLAISLGRNEVGTSNRGKKILHHAVRSRFCNFQSVGFRHSAHCGSEKSDLLENLTSQKSWLPGKVDFPWEICNPGKDDFPGKLTSWESPHIHLGYSGSKLDLNFYIEIFPKSGDTFLHFLGCHISQDFIFTRKTHFSG